MSAPRSLFLQSLLRTPLQWRAGQPWHQNLRNHLSTVYGKGYDQASRLYADDQMLSNLDPARRYQRLSENLAGVNPVLKNPWDRLLMHGPGSL